MTRRASLRWGAAVVIAAALAAPPAVHGQGRGGPPPGPRPTPRAAAPIDLTGYWVSVVTEDWRYRMVTPAKGDYQGVPMTREAATVADAWDPAADTAAGLQCKSYGAGMIMRVPGRIHVTWQDDRTLRLETDAGTQTRLFRFEPEVGRGAVVAGRPAERSAPSPRSWQGDATAQWELPRAARGRGAGPASAKNGSLKVVITNLRAGYLRKNGVPYSEDATVTEYYSVAHLRSGPEILVVTTVVDDPRYLTQPFIVSSQFKKLEGPAGWDPTPCSATW